MLMWILYSFPKVLDVMMIMNRFIISGRIWKLAYPKDGQMIEGCTNTGTTFTKSPINILPSMVKVSIDLAMVVELDRGFDSNFQQLSLLFIVLFHTI